MVIRRDEEPGYDEMRDVTRNSVVGGRLIPDGPSPMKSPSFTRDKSLEHSPASEAPKRNLLIDTPSRAQASSGAGAAVSILSLKMEIVGSITTTDELHVYGTVDGNVRAAALTICEGGVVKGEVIAETVVVQGTVDGRIFGKKVELRAGADVRGDITHGGLGIDTTAHFEGFSKRSQNPIGEAPALPSKA